MKKHIIGLALFSFIVSAAVFIYKNVFAVRELPPVKSYSVKTVTGDANRKVSKELRVEQGVYKLKSKLLVWELSAPKVNSPVVFHFFVKDEKGTRHITSGQGVASCLIDAKLEFKTYYSGLDNLKSYENLYVVPEFGTSSKVYDKGFEPKFDVDKATPILIDSGENDIPPITD